MSEFPTLVDIYDDYSPNDYAHYMISIDWDYNWDLLLDFWNDHPEFHPSTAWAWDPSLDSFHTYKDLVGFVEGIPQHFIIDRDGYLRWGSIGSVGTDKTIITQVINELI